MKDKKLFGFIFEYEQKVFSILFAIFFVGFLWGSYSLFKSSDVSNNSDLIVQASTFLFKKLFIKNVVLLLTTFLLGYTVIGFPFLCFCVLYNGIYCGVTLSVFTSVYGFKGCFVSALVLFPYYLLLVFSHYFVTFSSLRLSASLYSVFKEGTRYISPKTYSKPHIIKFAFFALTAFVCSALCSFVLMPIVLKIL